jgi:hypothetical protein
MKPMTLQELINMRIAAKREEDKAVQARRDVDSQIAELLRDATKPEGSVSQKLDGYKVTVTYKVDRKVSADELQKLWDKLSPEVQAVFKWKPDVSVSELRKLDDKQKISASRFITSNAASPSIKIEAI